MRKDSGFTLVELLVVLVLMATVMGLFLDPIARVYDLKARLRAFIDQAPDTLLPPLWFQKTVKGLFVGEEKFEGTADRFAGETIVSFDAEPGVPMPFSWEIAHNTDTGLSSLTYITASDEPRLVLEWQGESGAFSYFDPEAQKWVDEWQSSPFVKQDDFRLPTLIRFEADKDGKPLVIQASLEISRPWQKDLLDTLGRETKEMYEKQALEKEEGGGNELFGTPPQSQSSLLKKENEAKEKVLFPDDRQGGDGLEGEEDDML